MTRDGFTLLAMGFIGAVAVVFNIRYIARFNEMEAEFRQQGPAAPRTLGEALRLALDEHERANREADRADREAAQSARLNLVVDEMNRRLTLTSTTLPRGRSPSPPSPKT
jgi:phage regulator Rha-like protein